MCAPAPKKLAPSLEADCFCSKPQGWLVNASGDTIIPVAFRLPLFQPSSMDL